MIISLGIHGLPFEPWDEVSGENASGYCAHNSILFGPWHRAYLALVEQIISTHARDIAMLYPTDLSAVYTAAARELRIPYWDWANSTTMPDIVTIPQIEIQGPEGMQRIQNPLYSYTFESDDLGTTLPSRFFVSQLFLLIKIIPGKCKKMHLIVYGSFLASQKHSEGLIEMESTNLMP